jgi:hypothetical protein
MRRLSLAVIEALLYTVAAGLIFLTTDRREGEISNEKPSLLGLGRR